MEELTDMAFISGKVKDILSVVRCDLAILFSIILDISNEWMQTKTCAQILSDFLWYTVFISKGVRLKL